MEKRPILLVEDNSDDELLAVRALRQSNVRNPIVVLRDGEEALDYLFRTGPYAERDPQIVPQVILLDLKLPKIDGLDVLRRLRGDERTKRLPIVVLTFSKEESDLIRSYDLGANSYVCKPVDFPSFVVAAQQLHLYWMVLNEPSPS